MDGGARQKSFSTYYTGLDYQSGSDYYAFNILRRVIMHTRSEPSSAHRFSMFRVARVAGIILFVAAGSVAVVLSARHSVSQQSQAKSRHHGRGSQSAISTPISPDVIAGAQPPFGYGTPLAIAPDITAPGVWYLAGLSSDVSLFHWNDGTKQLTRYSLGSPQSNTALIIGDEVGLAVTTDSVWVGSRDTLFELDTNTGTISSVTVPAPIDNPYVESHRPAAIQGFHGIESIAVSPADGDIAVAMEGAESVAVYDPTSGEFSTVELADSDAPLSVAYTSDGTLAVSAVAWPSGREGVMDLASASGGTINGSTMDVGFITGDGTNVLGTGTSQISVVDPTGGPSTTALYSAAAPPADGAIDPEVPPVGGPGGVVVAGTTSGLVVLRTGQAAETLDLPSAACVISGPAPPSTTVQSGPTTCQTVATGIAIDSDGNIWFTPNVGQLSEIPVSSY